MVIIKDENEPHPVFQGLMNDAYERWQEPDNKWSREEFMGQCSDLERKAVLLGNLNYQVCNGGFCQWVDNGYGLEWQEVVEVLKEIGTENALKTINLIERFAEYINLAEDNHGFGDYWAEETDEFGFSYDDDFEEYESEGPYIARDCDNEFYDFNETLCEEIEEFLANGGKPNENPSEAIDDPRKPEPKKPVIKGPIDGNAFAIMGHVRRALRKTKTSDEIDAIMEEAMSGDYDHLLATCMEHVEFDI